MVTDLVDPVDRTDRRLIAEVPMVRNKPTTVGRVDPRDMALPSIAADPTTSRPTIRADTIAHASRVPMDLRDRMPVTGGPVRTLGVFLVTALRVHDTVSMTAGVTHSSDMVHGSGMVAVSPIAGSAASGRDIGPVQWRVAQVR
jgi:hypothetical protein